MTLNCFAYAKVRNKLEIKKEKGEKFAKLQNYSYLCTKLTKVAPLLENERGSRKICNYLFFLLCYD